MEYCRKREQPGEISREQNARERLAMVVPFTSPAPACCIFVENNYHISPF